MRAVIQEVYGGPEVLRLGEVEAPRVGDHDVLVDVRASAVTRGDLRLRAADFPSITWLPGRLALGLTGPRARVPGSMVAGRIAAVGPAVTRFVVGDDVFGSPLAGAWADQVVMRADGALARIPAGVSYEEAAATPYGAVTAAYVLRSLGRVRSGERVLVNGAAGGVGDFLVQVAKVLGAEVTAVGSRRSFDRMRLAGADHLVDHATEDFTTRDGAWDVVVDTADVLRFGRVRRALSPGGRFATIDVSIRVLADVVLSALVGTRKARWGVSMGGRAEHEEVAGWLARGVLRPHVRATFPLARIGEANVEAARRGVDGAVVVAVA